MRAVGRRHPTDRTAPADPPDCKAYDAWLYHSDAAVVANAVLCLIHQANYLLDQQISALERDFVKAGGYSEQLAMARIAERRKQDQADQTDPSDQMEARHEHRRPKGEEDPGARGKTVP